MHQQFSATLQKSPNQGGWTYLIWPDSVEFFGTRGLVKVRGDDRRPPVPEAPSWPRATARHELPVKAEVRRAIGKQAGDTVTVLLEERIDES